MTIGIFSSYNYAGNTQTATDVHPAFTAAKLNDHTGLYTHLLTHMNVMASGSTKQNDYTPSVRFPG
ncbi:MAG: hypothetical protein WC748_01800 [Legionellales bacterium]|jgi:hypothetical protein